LKKVLILTYFFPPANFAGSDRMASWAKYLHGFGYYPVIVTRKFRPGISSYEALSESSGGPVEHEKTDAYEIFRLPYKGNLRDRLLFHQGKNKYRLFRKFLTFTELLLQYFTLRVIPWRNLYHFSASLLAKENFSLIITSGKPYILFRFCYLLGRKYKIPWIADYRDPWTTHPLNKKNPLLGMLDRKFEKKWVSTAACITSCSAEWCRELESFLQLRSRVVYNGYEESSFGENFSQKPEGKKFTLLYSGTLYRNQNAELFMAAFRKFVNESRADARVIFAGISIDPSQLSRIKKLSAGMEAHLEFYDRADKQVFLNLLAESHICLIFGHESPRGWLPIKIFEYMAARRHVMLVPGDNSSLENLIRESGCGVCCKNEKEAIDYLNIQYQVHIQGSYVPPSMDSKQLSLYSRRMQAAALAAVLMIH
jgi:glycosyltransferase involved in cell wall biosynthesis